MYNFVLGRHDQTDAVVLLLVPSNLKKPLPLNLVWESYSETCTATHAGQAFFSESGFFQLTGCSVSMNLDAEGIDIMEINEVAKSCGFVETVCDDDDDRISDVSLLILNTVEDSDFESPIYVHEESLHRVTEVRDYYRTTMS